MLFSGSLLAMCHQLMVTGLFELACWPLELVLALSLSSPPHAATTSIARAAISPASGRLNFSIV
jgi:hypothetical protein